MRWALPEQWKSLEMAFPDQRFSYGADEAFFVENYRALIDEVQHWSPRPAIVIWGFLRDTHGGEAAAHQVASYAAERGVGVLVGVGTSGYGGVYYEGKHRYSAQTLMDNVPELTVENDKVDAEGRSARGRTLNPLDPRVLEWLEEGIAWLQESFPISGVNLELGDFFVARDGVSIARRAAVAPEVRDEFFQMLALHYGDLAARVLRRSPGLEISYATYSDFDSQTLAANGRFASYLPSEAICQWTLTRSVETTDRRTLLPTRNRGYAHLFSTATQSAAADVRERISRMCRIAAMSGFEGVGMYGELGIDLPWGRENYEAFQHFTAAPWEGVA